MSQRPNFLAVRNGNWVVQANPNMARWGEPVDLIDDDDINLPCFHIIEQLAQRGALHSTT